MDAGAKLNSVECGGKILLHLMVTSARPDAVAQLLALGADWRLPDRDTGDAALSYAIKVRLGPGVHASGASLWREECTAAARQAAALTTPLVLLCVRWRWSRQLPALKGGGPERGKALRLEVRRAPPPSDRSTRILFSRPFVDVALSRDKRAT